MRHSKIILSFLLCSFAPNHGEATAAVKFCQCHCA